MSGKTPPRIMWRRRIFLIKVKISCSFSPVFLPKTKPPLYIGGQEVENNRKNCAVYLIFHDPPDRNQEFFFIATHDTVCVNTHFACPNAYAGFSHPIGKTLADIFILSQTTKYRKTEIYTHRVPSLVPYERDPIPHILIKTPTKRPDNTEHRFLINTLTSRTAPTPSRTIRNNSFYSDTMPKIHTKTKNTTSRF